MAMISQYHSRTPINPIIRFASTENRKGLYVLAYFVYTKMKQNSGIWR